MITPIGNALGEVQILRKDKIEKPVIGVFFILVAIVGLFSYKSYGISWDEAAQRLNGGTSLIYVAEKLAPSLIPKDKLDFPKLGEGGPTDHGVAFDAPLVALEQLLGIRDSQSIYELRHFVNFFVFFLGIIAVFNLIKRRFNNYKFGLLGASFFVISPRFFAEGFYNNKDIIFTSLLVITIDFMFRYFGKGKRGTLFLTGVLSGIATDVRVAGIGLILAFLFGILLLSLGHKGYLKEQLRPTLIYLVTTISTIYVFFPWIWSDPIARFWQALTSMSKYNWDGKVLYAGQQISSLDLPWHYAFTWIAVTTPVLYLFLSVFGIVAFLKNLSTIRTTKKLEFSLIQDTIMLAILLAPLMSIFILKPVLYDGWRHLYFVYPSLIFSSILGWQYLLIFRKAYFRKILILITSVSLVSTSLWMYQNRPMQNLYFNILAGEDLKNRWDFDYWGLGNRIALNYLIKNDKRKVITIYATSFTPLFESTKMLDANSRSKIQVVNNIEKADYLLDNYRIPRVKIDGQLKENYPLYKNFKVGKEVYLTLYKRIGS